MRLAGTYRIGASVGLALGLAMACAQGQAVNLQSLLEEITNRDAVARFPQPAYQALTASSYNRASYNRNQPDQTFSGWFADGDGTGYIRIETNAVTGHAEWVLMEHQGPGCITRLWTPFFYYDFNNRVGPNMRIYLDGSPQPVLDESLIKLVTAQGSVGYPFAAYTARAGDLYLPIPFAQSCKVTMTAQPFYYNVAYRAYTNGTPVQTFTLPDFQALGQLRTNVATVLTSLPGAAGGTTVSNQFQVPAGQTQVIDLPPGPTAVRQFTIQLPAAVTNSACLRSTVLAMSFDGEQTVWCPVGDFFSSADSVHPFQTWQRTVRADGEMVCSWQMPYQAGGTITVVNLATQAVAVVLEVTTSPWSWDARSMHFHANWRPDDVRPGTPPSDWNFIDVQGQGVYVGDSWSVLNIQTNSWWGEGDEKIYVDADWQNGFPSQFGTGSEDYYGWAGGVLPSRADEFSYPFLANVRVGGLDGCTVGYNVNTRSRSLDAIPFTSRLVFDMESSFGTDIRNPWDLLGYAVATFWYALPGATNNRPPAPAQAAQPIVSRAQLQAQSNAIRYGTHTGTGPGARWNMGEQDPGAAAGGAGLALTRDAVGTNALSAFGAPIYSANVPPGGSTLSLSFDGASYYQSGALSNLYSGINFNRFSLSCDVYLSAPGTAGFSFPVSIGVTGSSGGGGLGIVEIGGTWEIIHHMVQETSGGPAAALNTWTHLELLRKDFGSGVQTRLLINGTDSGLSLNSSPNEAPPFFTIGANPNPESSGGIEGQFRGQVDNVLVQNLNPVIARGPVLSPAGGTVAAGAAFTVSVVATGEEPLTYLWRHDGDVVGSAPAGASLTISNATAGQTGNYDVVITNAYGAVTSSIVAVTVLAPGPVPGRAVATYRLGEDDPGAVAGGPGNLVTRELNGTNALSAVGRPVYSADVPPGGSVLSMSFDGSSAYEAAGAGISNLYRTLDFNNIALSCDVRMTQPGAAGFSFPVSIGGTGGDGGGIAIVEIGGTWELIHHGVQETAGGPAVSLNTWTHLDLERKSYGSAVQTRLFVNGVDSGLFLDSAPAGPGPYLTVAANPNSGATGGLEGYFNGWIDNVALATLSPARPWLTLRLVPGQVQVESDVSPGTAYTLWRTGTLKPPVWTSLLNVTTDLSGISVVVDSNPPPGQAFYRTTTP